ncbi:DUF1501 domain-containing protein [Coraliomargarita parva]|uniref:DUF1501 domain-containing protein n=1 Tax=Coraliomargarita parva TaxID=3014050 RepID=UPI0022B5BE9D|nr:DUF1501 domain-containing protein [Coraliomargarita parva]
MKSLPLTRREFIRRSSGGLGFLAFSGFAPSFLTQSAMAQTPAPERNRTILVIIQLAGGNDGLNTIVPYADDRYYNLRPKLGLKDGLLKLNDQVALNPACNELYKLFDSGQLSVIQNVGYPNPNRSHFRSTEIWETAGDGEQMPRTGWLGRYLDNACSGSPDETPKDGPDAVHVSDLVPQSLLSDTPHDIFGIRARGRTGTQPGSADEAYEAILQAEHGEGPGSYLQQVMMNTLVTERRVERIISKYRPSTNYAGNTLAQSLKRVAALIHSDLETRVYFVSQSGYDTHANQLNNHARLLGELSDAMQAFQQDLNAHGKADQVLTMTFSEFGRRPAENGSQGTDHGTAAPLFVMGAKAKGGIIGSAPDLGIGPKEDLKFSTDFRSIYATVLDRWLSADAAAILGKQFQPLPFV